MVEMYMSILQLQTFVPNSYVTIWIIGNRQLTFFATNLMFSFYFVEI